MNAGRHKRMILFLLAGSAAVILAAAFSVLYGSTGIPANQAVSYTHLTLPTTERV